MNGRFFRRVAAPMILQLRHFLCCERVQRENRTHRLGLAAAARQKIWNDGCLRGNGALCSDQPRNLNILKNLAQDTTTNANGSSQDVRTSPVAALPHGGSEPSADLYSNMA
jgi:hypothetical protein